MAEVITDAVAGRLGVARRCRTRDFALDGAPSGPWEKFAPAAASDLKAVWGLHEEAATHLVNRYGRRAFDVAARLGRDPALRAAVVPGEPDLLAEFAYHREQEMALAPADFLLRRTRLGLFHPDLLARPPAALRPDAGSSRAGG
jgi:glycerol-3-phosphate dehydrogenase